MILEGQKAPALPLGENGENDSGGRGKDYCGGRSPPPLSP